MREILFRGKRIDNGEWVQGSLSMEYFHECGCVMISPSADDCYKVDYSTVGQFTGLTDKNGKKIFEGDLIRHYNRSNQPETYDLYRIEFDVRGCMWVGRYNDNYAAQLRDYLGEYYEVVGNIHDNPELLEVTDDA